MARKKAFDVEEALTQAAILFWLQGYEATSMPDLVRAMGIGRQSIYDTFGTKHDLFMAALRLYCEQYAAVLLEPVEAPDAGLAEVERYLRNNVKSYFDEPGARSCFMVNATMEAAPADPEVAEYVGAFHRRIEAALTNAVKNANSRGDLRENESTRSAARRLTALALGLPVYIRGGATKRTANETIASTIQSISH